MSDRKSGFVDRRTFLVLASGATAAVATAADTQWIFNAGPLLSVGFFGETVPRKPAAMVAASSLPGADAQFVKSGARFFVHGTLRNERRAQSLYVRTMFRLVDGRHVPQQTWSHVGTGRTRYTSSRSRQRAPIDRTRGLVLEIDSTPGGSVTPRAVKETLAWRFLPTKDPSGIPLRRGVYFLALGGATPDWRRLLYGPTADQPGPHLYYRSGKGTIPADFDYVTVQFDYAA